MQSERETYDEFEDTVFCGYCEAPCIESEIPRHECIQIFMNYFVCPETNVAWGADEKGEVINYFTDQQYQKIQNLKANKENNACNKKDSESESSKRTLKKPTATKSINAVQIKLDQEEQLILEVMNRPALWDITIPLPQRGKLVKQKQWSEVSDALKGCFTADGAKKKFKALLDVYRIIVRSEHCPSGSERKVSSSKWPHYNAMEFMRNQLNPRQTISNLDTESCEEIAEEFNSSNDKIETEPDLFSKRTSKKRKLHAEKDDLTTSFDKIAQAISGSSKEIVLPPPPEPNEIESCLNVIGCRLQKIPEEYISDAIHEMLNYSYDLLKKYQ